MELEENFLSFVKKSALFEQEERLLVAVSGGVDSMVLLHLLEILQKQQTLTIGVAHINHQLRAASIEEARYLANYCQKQGFAFYSKTWQEQPSQGIEAAARAFRYDFFQAVMEAEDYPYLLTAHHGDDQAETMVMKLIRGGSLKSHAGILLRQPFGLGELIRPLLPFSKEELYRYAATEGLVYFEDATNQEMFTQRNRLRKEVIPLLKAENPQFLKHVQQFSQQLLWGEELIQEMLMQQLASEVEAVSQGWRVAFQVWQQHSLAWQYFAFFYMGDTYLKQNLKEEQVQQLLTLCQSGPAQWRLALEGPWQVRKSYQNLYFEKLTPESLATSISLAYGEGVYLNEKEWIGLFPADQAPLGPEELADWVTLQWPFASGLGNPLTLRHRQAGDKIQLQATLQKKLRRFFIDQKISQPQREKAWVIVNEEEEILGLLPFALSYLSIPKETDKIHYILLYKYQE